MVLTWEGMGVQDPSLYERVAPLDKNFPVKFALHYGACYLHWHEHMELLYFLSDGDKVFCGDAVYTLRAGDVLVVNPNALHATYAGRFYCMRLSPAFFADIRFEGVLITPHIAKDDVITECFTAIARAKEENRLGSDMRIKAEAYRLLSHLVENYRTESLSDGRMISEKNKASRVGDIVRYMTDHCHERITTATLAEHFHIDEHYLCRLFKSQMGKPPMQYLNEYRVEKACALLENTAYSVTDAALAVGFDDASYFARVFKKQTGVSPRNYRKKE